MTLEIVCLSSNKRRLGGEWVTFEMASPIRTPSTQDAIGAGPDWEQSAQAARPSLSVRDVPTDAYKVHLPFVSVGIWDVPTGCPCGRFDNLGRTLSFWP